MSRADIILEGIKKGKEGIADLVETGSDFIKRLGGDTDVDTVVKNAILNKQRKLEQVAVKRGNRRLQNLKNKEQVAAKERLLDEAFQRREQELRDYIDQDPIFGDALDQIQVIKSKLIQGKAMKELPGYDDFLENFKDIYKNRTNSREAYDKFDVIYDAMGTQTGRSRQLDSIVNNMINKKLIKPSDVMSIDKTIEVLKNKGVNTRGYTKASQLPSFVYDYLVSDVAKITKNYKDDFIKKYGQEPIGRSFTREGWFNYVLDRSPLLKNYYSQTGVNRGAGTIDASGDLKDFANLFKLSKEQFPDLVGDFTPGTLSSLRTTRYSDYVADYQAGGIRWNDGSVIKKGSQVYKDIENFKEQILEFIPKGQNTGPIGTNLNNQINRMINKQVIAGTDPVKAAENAAQVLNKTDPQSMPKIYDILNKKEQITKRVQQARDKGITADVVDDISLAHVEDVADDYRLALNIDNLFLAPLQGNIKQYRVYDKALKSLQDQLQSGVSTPGMTADITRQIDDIGKQLEFEGIVTDVGYGRVGKAKSPDDVVKMYDDQVDFYMAQPEDRLYTAEINERIKEGAQGPGFAEGGPVGGPEPMVDEETGMLDYLSDKKKQFEDFTGITKMDESLQDYVEEDLDGNPFRAVPVAISQILKAPGAIRDFFVENQNKVNQDLEENALIQEQEGNTEIANQMRSLKSGEGILGSYDNPITIGGGFIDLMTAPLQEGYENMFTEDDYFYNPFTGEKFMADTAFKKGIAAGATVGLTAIEVMLAFNPIKIKAIGKLPPGKARAVLQGGADLLANAGAIIIPYETKESNIRDLFGITEDIRSENSESVEDMERAEEKLEQRNVEGNQLEYAEGGLVDPLPPEFTGEYAETKLAMGGEPGQFSNPTPSGLEEEIDVGDYLLDPAYESVQDLDNIFDITRQAEDAFETDGGFLDDQAVEVASRGERLKYIFGEVPNWVRQGKERIQMGIEKILPKTGDELEDAYLTRLDEIDEGLTPITKSQPGQLFYSKLEAELMQGPKEYKDVEAFKKYYQSRNIPKIEIIDSELERIIEGATKAGQPISRELVLGALKESPIRYVQSKGYGFLSDVLDGQQRRLKYSGYKEYGAIPNTDRERLLFIDPNDLRGDPGRLPPGISPHDWEEPYTIAWSRLSDRQLGGKFTGKTTTFADEIQSDIFQAAQKTAGKLSAKIKYMAQNNVPLDTINNELQRDMMTFFADKGTVYRESLPGSAQLQKELQALMGLQDQLTALKNTPVPEITDEMLEAAQKVRYQQNDIIDNMTEELNLQLVKQLYPNLPFKLRGQWADASIKRDIYEAAYRKFVLKDPNATDYYAVTPANLVTKRYTHSGSSATSQADRVADKDARIKRWVDGGMEGEIAPSQYPGIGMYEFYGGPGADVVTDTGKHYTSEIEKIMKRIAKENNVNLEVLPVRVGDQQVEVFNVVNRETGEILGTGNTGRQADAIANDIIDNSDIKVIVERANQFDTADSFGIELTPEMAEAFKAYMAKGGYVQEEIVRPYGD